MGRHTLTKAGSTDSRSLGSRSLGSRSLGQQLRTSLSAALLLLVIGLGVALVGLPKLAGAMPLTVLTNSMEPTLPPGTLIVMRPVAADDIAIGDVVTYQIRSGEPDVITHRVSAITMTTTGARSFTFKGDNNAEADAEQVTEPQVLGRLWYSVPLAGYLSQWMNSGARGVIVPVAAGALFVFAAVMMVSGLLGAIRRRVRRQARELQADEFTPLI